MGKDEELVARWQKTKDQQALNELRRSVRPLTQSQVNKYRANSVPMAVLEAKADQIVVESANSYKGGFGATFKTFLFGNLRRLNRFSAARSNVATIPEARTQKISVFQRAFENLSEEKHRPPTSAELADHLSWPMSEVMTMQRSLRHDINTSSMVRSMHLDTTNAKDKQLIDDIWWELTPDEKHVFEYLTGTHGRREIKKGQDLAKATKFSQAKVSQLRKAIGLKMKPHL